MNKQRVIELDKKVVMLMEPVLKAGYQIYIVGGFVRDCYLGLNSYDLDLCTTAPMDVLENIYKEYKLNKQAIQYGALSFNANHYSVQITRLRKDSILSDGRYPDSIEFVDTIELDYQRRDFTINALYCDINGNIIDLCNGLNDLSKGIINTVIDPSVSFKQDCLRILRALRFANRFNFKFSDSVRCAFNQQLDSIRQLSSFRMHQELENFGLQKGFNTLIEDYKKVLSTYFGKEILLYKLPTVFVSETVFFAYQFRMQNNDYIKFVLNKFGYNAKYANTVIEVKPFLVDNTILDVIFKKRLASKYFTEDILKDLSIYYELDLVDEVDHLQRMDIVLTQKQIKCSTNDMKKIGIAPHEFKNTYQFLLEALYTNQVKNNKDALLQYIKDHRLELKEYMYS